MRCQSLKLISCSEKFGINIFFFFFFQLEGNFSLTGLILSMIPVLLFMPLIVVILHYLTNQSMPC